MVLFLDVDAQRHGDRGQEVLDADGSIRHLGSVGASLADDLSALDAAAGQHRRPRVRPVIAAAIAVDFRRASKLAHPDKQGRLQHAALFEVAHQGGPGRIEHCTKALDAVEVVEMRIPAEGQIAHGGQRYLDERHAMLDEPTRQQTALAEQITAVGVAQLLGFLIQVERLRGARAHEGNGALVGAAVALGWDGGARVQEVLLHFTEQLNAGGCALGADAVGESEVFYLQSLLVIALPAGDGEEALLILADDQRSVARAEKAGTIRRRAEKAIRRHADETGQFRARLLQLFREQRSHRRIVDWAAGDVPGAHLVGGPSVVGLLGAHRADERHVLHVSGDLRQMLADFDAGDAGGDLLVGSAVGVAGLQIEGVHLAGTAVHPEEDARPLALGMSDGVRGQRFQPAREGVTHHPRGGQTQPIAPR
jgi:hypothetical protein